LKGNAPMIDPNLTAAAKYSRFIADRCRIERAACEKLRGDLNPFRLVSLLEIIGFMDGFNAEDLSGISDYTGRFYVLAKLIESDIPFPSKLLNVGQPLSGDYDKLRSQLAKMGCDMSVKAFDRMMAHPAPEPERADKDWFAQEAYLQGQFTTVLHDELASITFLSVTGSHRNYYVSPLEGWEDVVNAFPDTAFEVTESSKCYALNRHTATVFHIMRAVEIGILALLKSIGKTSPSMSWGSYIQMIEVHTKQNPAPVNKDVLVEVVAHLRSVKDAWRNGTMHVDKKFTSEEAWEIYNASKSILRSIIKVI